MNKTKKKCWIVLWSLCVLSVLLELGLHRHGHFSENSIDGVFGFFAILGFMACVVCIGFSKAVTFLKVKGNYYDK